MLFTKRETATILAALRVYQRTTGPLKITEHFAEVDPLTNAEIDELCESINCASGRFRNEWIDGPRPRPVSSIPGAQLELRKEYNRPVFSEGAGVKGPTAAAADASMRAREAQERNEFTAYLCAALTGIVSHEGSTYDHDAMRAINYARAVQDLRKVEF